MSRSETVSKVRSPKSASAASRILSRVVSVDPDARRRFAPPSLLSVSRVACIFAIVMVLVLGRIMSANSRLSPDFASIQGLY